jgi:hypothetical protein
MTKKTKYEPPDEMPAKELEALKVHNQVITEKERIIRAKYRRWWSLIKKKWKLGFPGHEDYIDQSK